MAFCEMAARAVTGEAPMTSGGTGVSDAGGRVSTATEKFGRR